MSAPWPLTLYHDGDCPLCAREIAVLRRRALPGRLILQDIRDPAFDPSPFGLDVATLAGRLHGRLADGRWVTGLDATVWSWRAAGFERAAGVLGWRWLRPLLDGLYRLFCRLRPQLHWLPHPDGGRRCKDDQCQLP